MNDSLQQVHSWKCSQTTGGRAFFSKVAATAAVAWVPSPAAAAAKLQNFERVLSREPFLGLKAILAKISPAPEVLWGAVQTSNSYEDLLAKLGYKITLTKQIHVQDCYSRLGADGGIMKFILPYHDVVSHNSFPTLINFDSTVTITPKATASTTRRRRASSSLQENL